MIGKTRRRVTKPSENPVAIVRKSAACLKLSLVLCSDFSEQHIKNVECKSRISLELRNRIYILTGAWIDEAGGLPVSFGERDETEPFTSATYLEWKAGWANGGVVRKDVDTLVASLRCIVEVMGRRAKEEGNYLLIDLLHFGLCKGVRALIEEYGLREEIRKEILILSGSPIRQKRLLAYYLSEFSDSWDYVKAFSLSRLYP